MSANKITRRSLLIKLTALTNGTIFSRYAHASDLTPRATEGPFYPKPAMRMSDVDNDLVKIIGLVQEAGGEVIILKGKITDSYGKPLVNHRIEIWQCDLNGKYLHPSDNRNIIYDQGFQGFGHDITSDDGSYSFRTIKPGKYPGRTEHIHVKVFNDDTELLTTQFYVMGNPENKNDTIFRQMSDTQAESVSMSYVKTHRGIETTVDIKI